MKCNILKARMEEDLKKGWHALPEFLLDVSPYIVLS
jgi:hypothetical protein